MDDYWDLLPRYQGVNIDDLKFLRILYGMFIKILTYLALIIVTECRIVFCIAFTFEIVMILLDTLVGQC